MSSTALATAAITIAVLMVGTWLVSVALKNASIVDIVWDWASCSWRGPYGCVSMAWTPCQNLLVLMTTVWGLRLSVYLAWRNHGKGEDFRYVAMRRHWGPRFPIISLFTVYGLQGLLMFVVSLGVQLGQVPDTPAVGWLAGLGVVVWVVGLFFEVVGDAQLARFKADETNKGKVMDRGLWRYTRHPNYFGDACVWWGIALVAAETTLGLWGLLGAVVMTVLLRRVSGVVLLEKSLGKRKPGYAEYVARTSAFLPRPPKRA